MTRDQPFRDFVDHKTTIYSIIRFMSSLTLPKALTPPKVAGVKRMASVEEAISWPSGTDVAHKVPTIIFSRGRYTVRLSKPGKEAAPDYNRVTYKDKTKGNNPNDMRPEIAVDGKTIEKNATFTDIFGELFKLHQASREGIELMACLLARNAFMADHLQVAPGIWRYTPPEEYLIKLGKTIPLLYDVPVEVFLHYLDALALNEDTKYHTLGYDITKDTGRKNNLLTCVKLIGVLLEEISFADFAGGLISRRGVSPITLTKMYEIFPELADV